MAKCDYCGRQITGKIYYIPDGTGRSLCSSCYTKQTDQPNLKVDENKSKIEALMEEIKSFNTDIKSAKELKFMVENIKIVWECPKCGYRVRDNYKIGAKCPCCHFNLGNLAWVKLTTKPYGYEQSNEMRDIDLSYLTKTKDDYSEEYLHFV